MLQFGTQSFEKSSSCGGIEKHPAEGGPDPR
jgi:hypothetical protein